MSIQPNGAWLTLSSTNTVTDATVKIVWVAASFAMIWTEWGPFAMPRARNDVRNPGFAVGLSKKVGKISRTSGRGRPVSA